MEDRKKLFDKFPYHPINMESVDRRIDKYMAMEDCFEKRLMLDNLKRLKEWQNVILESGLIIDSEYNIFVLPGYGAFFYNTSSKTMQEEISHCEDVLIMNYHCYIPQEELLSYIRHGYEFELGPCIKLFGDESLNGVYCKNYKTYTRKIKKNS